MPNRLNHYFCAARLLMKRNYTVKKELVIILILLSSLGIKAQEIFVPKTTIGIKQGVNFSRVNFDPVVEQTISLGYTGGLVFKHFAQKNLGIQIEINYSQQGWTEKGDSTHSYSRQLNAITIPFMTHVELGKGNTKFLMNVGPNISYLISEKENIQLTDTSYTSNYYGNNSVNKSQFGLTVGMGLVKTTPIGLFQIEFRYNHSLSDIFKNTAELSILACKQQTLEINFSYLIDFNKFK